MDWHRLFLLFLHVSALVFSKNAPAFAELKEKRLAFVQHSKCTYSYEVAVHTARGSKSTESDGYQLHALVDVTSVSREQYGNASLHLYKLDVRQPRLRRVLYGRTTSYPVVEQFEEQLSKPFYFRQKDHGTLVDVLFPKATESPQVAALKKGITGAFQVNLRGADKAKMFEVQEHDDSGIFRSKYNVLADNDTHAHLHRTWTNHDYKQFADGTPAQGEHKMQSQHSAHVHFKNKRIEQVHRSMKAFFRSPNGHHRAENFKDFEKQDIEISTSGYSKLSLRCCSDPQHRRAKRSVIEKDNLDSLKTLSRDSLLITDAEKINWSEIGGDNKKARPLHEVLRCFVDKTIKEREIAYCSTELHHMIRNDEGVFKAIKRLVQNRNHQNETSWGVYVSALAAHGKYEAQNALAHAVKTRTPRHLSDEEYESLLVAIHYIPNGPLHYNLFEALLELAFDDTKEDHITATAMLVLAGLAERAKTAGYNETLSDSVAEMIYNRYRNKSSLYHPDSIDYEMQLRDHIWAFGNLGHHSGLSVILEHIDHDDSSIRSAVISAMRKMPGKYTDQHLLTALYQDEQSDVKAAVVSVFVDRHQNLSDSIVEGLEHAMWYAKKGEKLDSAILELLENHGNHSKAKYLRKRRSLINRRKRALIPALRPREFKLGRSKNWDMVVGGEWLGAEAAVQFANELSLQVGIFGGKIELNLDNFALIRAHILKYGFEIAKGKAAFKASASFKNDFPKDLIHTVADAGDDLLRQFDSITSVVTTQIEKFRKKLAGFIPLRIGELTGFVNSLDQFLKNLTIPLLAIKGANKVVSFSKDVGVRVKRWKSLIERISNIQQNLVKMTGFDILFKKALSTFNTILGVVDGISKYLPKHLPESFSIKELLQLLRKTSASQQTAKIKEYFNLQGSSVPDGFSLQLPVKLSIHFSLSLAKFQDVLSRVQRFSNSFLDILSLLDSIEGIRLPALSLPFLKLRSPTYSENRFNFGVSFDWRVSLKFNLQLKSPDFKKFISILGEVGAFFGQFTHQNFDLEKFFQELMPGEKFDLKTHFPELYRANQGMKGNSIDPPRVLQTFLSTLTDKLDFKMLNVSDISDMTDFFQELGPAVTQFAEHSVEKICKIHKAALDYSHKFKGFGEKIEKDGISVLKEIDDTTQKVLKELISFTVLVETSIGEIERNFTSAAKGFVSNSLQELTGKIKIMKDLAGEILDFTNGTSSSVSGACTKAASFTADVLDEVQSNARQTLNNLTSFIGPVATKIKSVGKNVKSAVTKVEKWYNENLADRVGKLSHVAQIVSDFLSILDTKKGFLNTVREIASRLNEVLKHLRNIPQYATKAKKTVDEVINFANRVQNYKDEIQKLDFRKQFGIDFDQRVKSVCNEFQAITTETLNKLRSFNVVQEVNYFFNQEASTFIDKALSKFRRIKGSVKAIQGEIKEISSIVAQVMAVLVDLKPFIKKFSPVLTTVEKLPDCQQMKEIILDSTRPCIRKAQVVGRSLIHQYKDLKTEIEVLNSMVPEAWKNFKIQKCIKSGTCISKAFIEQGKVVKNKVNSIKAKFDEASEYSDLLKMCEDGVNNITAVVDVVKLLVEQVRNFSIKDDIQRVMAMLQKVTGRKPGKAENGRRKRSIKNVIASIERISDYIQKIKDIDNKLHDFQESTFQALRSVYDDAISKHIQSLIAARSKLQLLYELWQKTRNVDNVLRALDIGAKNALTFADKLEGVSSMFSSPTISLLVNTGEISDVVKPYLDKYAFEASKAVDEVNGFVDKVGDFLNKIQTRQRGLDTSAYRPWQDIPYCSQDVCLRSIRRSSSLYLSTIFTWKFPHLDDLSSMQKSGRWLTPGLFDDYKVEGISQLSNDEMILGMHGVASSEEKASLLVVTNFDKGVKKIVQLTRQGQPLSVKIGGVAIARDYIWISDSNKNEILSIQKSTVKSTLSSSNKPSRVDIAKIVSVEGTAASVSYDEVSNVLWVTSSKVGKAYGYKLSVNGDLATFGLAPDRVIHIGENAQGMTIVRQFGNDYACISKCALIAGFQCKLEFHDLSKGDETGEKTLARVVRAPSGLESVNRVDNEVIAVAFSSGTFAEKENVELVGGDYEDRYFKLRLPILKTTFGINENCLYFRLLGDYILRPKPIFPIGDVICGSKRKRSISQELLETDVYHEKLEEIHEKNKRVRRNLADPGSCTSLMKGSLLSGSVTFFEVSTIIPVFGIPVRLFAGASGHYSVGFQAAICMKSKVFKLGLIPGAWVTAYAGASLALIVVEAGVTVEARLLETYLVPELRVEIGTWPLQACIELRQFMTPLSIRVYLWYRFIKIDIDVWFIGISISITWGPKRTFREWRWSAKQIDRILFTNCKRNVDKTPPVAGSCTARQAADKKYFIQWNGFKEDTKISAYQVRIGSIEGSGDDFSTWVDTSLSLMVTDLSIMHDRNVFVSVMATNNQALDSSLAYCKVFQARRKGPQIRFVYDGRVKGIDADYQSNTYSLGMNYAFKSDFKEIANLKWGVSSQPSCTFEESETNVLSLSSLGDSNAIQVSGLNLQHGKKYFTRLYALNQFGLKAIMCSDGILIDTTPPIPVSFQDGAGEVDAKFLPSLRRVRGKFEPFTDPESPIVKYEWKIVSNISGEDVTAFVRIPLTQQTPLMDGLSLESGIPYRLVLRGTNAAGLQSIIETNGFKPDNTLPHCEGNAIDVTDEADAVDVDFVRELENIQAKWKCFDPESGISSQLLGIGTYPGGDDVKAFEDVRFLSHTIMENGMSYVKLYNVTILPKVRYHVTIKIINGADLKKTIASDGILIDMTPPTVAHEYIKDGESGKDKNFSSQWFAFTAHWEQAFVDAESGMAEYRAGLGSKPGLADIKEFYTVGSQTNVAITGLLLETGRRYYVTVVGCNGVGMCVNASSNGATVDFVPPHFGKVITGLKGPPVLYQWITKSVWARWKWCVLDEKRISAILNTSQCSNDSFYDIHSGISMFAISVMSQKTDQLLKPFKLAGLQRYSGRNIDMEDGIYSVVIEARDKAGVTSRGLSNIFIVDSSPPLITLVQHGHFGETMEYVTTPVMTFRSYFMVEEDLSMITVYEIGVGSYSGADDVMNFETFSLRHLTSSLRANWTSLKPKSLMNNKRYFITILARNSAGLFTIKSSPPLLSDFEAPKNGFVMDGWGIDDAQYQSFSSLYRAHWYGFTDFSGVQSAYLGLSRKKNLAVCDVKKEELVSSNLDFHVLSGLALISGEKYYACLKLVDKAGNFAFFYSNGVTVDTSPPLAGFVSDGTTDKERDVQIERSVLRASWGNFTEKETRIVSYHLAFGSIPGAQDIQSFTNVGLVNTSTSSRMQVSELTTGHRYYATVIAFNVLGMPSSMVSSSGVLVDFTPPVFSRPTRDGDNPSRDHSYTSESFLKATWTCKDPETNISSIDIAFSLQPGEADIMNFTSLPVSQTSFIVNHKLQLGYRYFATVRCTNKVGLTSVSFSDGIVYDDTAPTPVYVRDGDYQDSNRTLFITFKFVDTESGVYKYRVQVWGGSLDSYGFFTFDGNVTRATLQLSKDILSGTTYYVNVTAVNGVGLEATKQSDGFIVDLTPPVCAQVWDGNGDYQDDQKYAPSSSRFVISWVCYDNESHIVSYRFSVKDVHTSKYTIPFYALKKRFNSSGSIIITGRGRTIPKVSEGHTYASGIEIVNAVGMKTVYWTNGITIDSTPPIVTNLKLKFHPQEDFLKANWLVRDDQSGMKSLSWGLGTTPETNDIKNYTVVSPASTNVSVSSVSFQQGITCFLNVLAVNKAGLLGRTSSAAVIVDRSVPNPGVVTAYHSFPRDYERNKKKVRNSSFVVSWTGFTDPESGIQKTSWAIGTNLQKLKQGNFDLYTKIVSSESVGGVIIRNQTLMGNETYFVCVRVTNGAGLHRTDCSPGMLIILGQLSAGVVSDGPTFLADDIDFQLDDKAIWAHWDGFKDPVYGISRYDWCIGDQPLNLSAPVVCKWPFTEVSHLQTKASRFHNLTLSHGIKYFITVKAENTIGDTIMSSSDGVVIDRTPPVGKSIQISPSTGKDTLFLTSSSAPVVIWSIDDPESGISHFLVSVGSFPFQNDLLSIQRVDSLSRSLDLDLVNFTIYEGLSFYVAVTGVNMLGLETTLVSQEVVVDWTPPDVGTVLDGNRTKHLSQAFIDSDYQSEKGTLFSHWSGFQDSESDVIEYHWCVGTSQGTCDVKRMNSAQLHTNVQHPIIPQEGVQYFFTLEVINGAGLTETTFSDGITVDTSPPIIAGVYHGVEKEENDVARVMSQNNGEQLTFYWDAPYDMESGISSVEWCAGTTNNSCNVVPFISVDPEGTSVKHYMSESLASGTVVFITLAVTNGVGMKIKVVTPPLLIDTTPPAIGNVTVGNTVGTKYFKNGVLITAEWNGFVDYESDLSYFEWAICQASAKYKCVSPFVNVALKTTLNIDALGLEYGVSYIVIVRAFNKVGLFSEATSNQFILDGTKPSPGMVYDGSQPRKDIEFQSSTTQLSANWSPFTDSNGNIDMYEMCVGVEPGMCDVSDFVSVGINLRGTVTGLRLKHNKRYYVTVQATSESGYSTTATSNGVRVDSTPAVGGVVRDGMTLVDIDYQADDTYIYANWDEFQDNESDVTSYIWCAGTLKGICDVVNETNVGERTSVSQQVLPPLPEGIEIFVTVSTLNNAGKSTTSSSDGFKVHSNAPVLSKVLDLQLGMGDYDVDFLTAKEEYCVRWDAMDSASGILRSELSICSDTNLNDCLLQGFDVGNKTSICIADLKFKEGVKYVTKVRTVNNVELYTDLFSDGFLVDTTPPLMGEILFIHNPWTSLKGAEQTFTHSKIAVKWDGFWDEESGIRTCYVCVGTQPGTCNIKNFTDARNATTFTFQDWPLVQGKTYFVSVKAENRAGLTSNVKTSDAVVVDKTGPFNGGVILDGSKQGEDIDIQRSRIEIAAHWNAFEDLESDVIRVTWCAGLSSSACDVVEETQLDWNSTFAHKVLTQPIMNGQRYYVTVTATNSAGVTTSFTSDGVTIDDTPPITGTVIDGIVSDVDYLNGEDDIRARWFGFGDLEAGIDFYEVALCDARNLYFRCPQPFTKVGKATNVTITGLDLQSGVQYMFIVRAVNLAGLKVEAFSNGFTVDFTPPNISKAWVGDDIRNVLHHSDSTKMTVSWIPFLDFESGIENYEVCLSSFIHNCSVTTLIDVGLNTSCTIGGLHLMHGKTYYAIVRSTNRVGMSSETITDGVVIDLTPPTLKDDEDVSVDTPSTLPPPINISLNGSISRANNMTLTRKNQSIPRVLLRCSEEHLMSSWDEFEDLESGMVEYDWCVGTSKALCDVVSLRSVGMKTRGGAIINKLRSGITLFSMVYAVNGAELRTKIISDPCTVISVAPKLIEVIDVSRLNTSNFTDIDWTATVQSLSLSWNVIGKYLNEVTRLRVQVAITTLSSNLSVPRLIEQKSWNGEPLKQPYMDVLSWQRKITIQSVPFQPWNRYRGIVRIWNEGGIYSEASSDGVKIEPSPPPERGLKIRDKAAENEHLRWRPNLRLPPLNQSSLDPDIKYISYPADLELMISSGVSNTTSNKTDYIFNNHLFSPTAEFKIVVKRASSVVNNTNTTFQSRTMKVIPGFSDSEGPCCARRSAITPSVLSDTHLKPTLPTEDFGVSIAVLPNDRIAIGSKDKVVIQSLKSQTASHSIALQDASDPNARVKMASHQNRTGFLLNGKVYLYEYKTDINELRKTIVIGKCKTISTSDCSDNETWADAVGQVFAVSDHVIAVTGTLSASNNSVVAVFRENAGVWTFAKVVGLEMKNPHFGQSIALNKRLMAIATGDGKNCCVSIYSVTTLVLRQSICLAVSSNHTAPLSMYLTETDALVVISRTLRLLKVVQLNSTSNTHHAVCEYTAWGYKEELSGNLDVNTREEGIVVALGIQTGNGSEGVQLLGFQGIYSKDFYEGVPRKCVNLGTILARDSGLRVDGLRTRTSVTFKEDTILFGLPGVLTWPNNDQWLSTGRVFMATYCPSDHFRSRVSGLQSLLPISCLPCKKERKSFGGFTETCSVCTERACPASNDSSIFTSGICDDESCVATTNVNNVTNGVNLHLNNGSFFVTGSENVYTVEFLETTRADQSTISISESFLIDSTSPEVGVVYDGLGSDQNLNCSENTTFGENSQCSTRNFEDTDVNYTNNTREIHARWIDFLDNESGIKEYFWCVGSQPMRDDIWVCESTGMRPNGSHYGLSLQHGDSYYVTVVACNGARKCSAAHSDGVTIDITPPVMKYVRDGVMGPDMDYQVFIDIIFGYFSASDTDSGVTSYEVAWGTGPNSTDISDFEEVINTTVWRAKLKDGALEKGKKYYATVRATNGAGLLSERLSSDGIIVGKTEFIFDNSSAGSFFFDTVNVNDDGTRKDEGMGQTYGTLTVPEGAVKEEVKLRCYSLDENTLSKNETEEGPVSNPTKTKPKQFMLGNYSFQIKALDPLNNTVQEGYRFVKPIKISMFYDVGNLVKANEMHVNNELTKEDVNPVLYLWDPENETWFDAALTCPEPWSHVNRSIKLLKVNVCHLTQFAFFWSFIARHGLILFDKNHSLYGSDGDIKVKRVQKVTKLEIPVRRSKGSQGDITVRWSLYHNDSSDNADLIWPSSGKLSMTDGQWNNSFIINVANNRKEMPENVVWVQLDDATGGALLSSRDQTTAKIVIASTLREDSEWIIIVVSVSVVSVIVLLVVSWCVRSYNKRQKRVITKRRNQESEMSSQKDITEPGAVNRDLSMRNPGFFEDSDHEMETTFSTFQPDDEMTTANPEKIASESGDGTRDSSVIQNVEHSPQNREDSDHKKEIKFSTFKPEDELTTTNPLYRSASGLTVVAVPEASANPLYQSASGLTVVAAGRPEAFANPLYESSPRLADVAGPQAIVNPLYESVNTVTGLSGDGAAANPLYEAAPRGEIGKVNFGVNDAQDGDDTNNI